MIKSLYKTLLPGLVAVVLLGSVAFSVNTPVASAQAMSAQQTTETIQRLQQQLMALIAQLTQMLANLQTASIATTSAVYTGPFTASPAYGPAPLATVFSIPYLQRTDYNLSFGDGTSTRFYPQSCIPDAGGAACSGTVSHTYTSPGTYMAAVSYPDILCSDSSCVLNTTTITVKGFGDEKAEKKVTIEEGELLFANNGFIVEGTAKGLNRSKLILFASTYNYGAHPLEVMEGQVPKGVVMESVVVNEKGRWATSFRTAQYKDRQAYYIYVYDSQSRVLLYAVTRYAVLLRDGSSPTCALQVDKPSYVLGDTIQLSWTSSNAFDLRWLDDSSGKDTLQKPSARFGNALPSSGTASVEASVYGNPTITFVAYKGTDSAHCSVKIPVSTVNANNTVAPTLSITGFGGQTYTAGDYFLFRVGFKNAKVGSWICASMTSDNRNFFTFPSDRSECGRTTTTDGDMVIQGKIMTSIPAGTYYINAELYYSSTGRWGMDGGQYPLATTNSGSFNMLATQLP